MLYFIIPLRSARTTRNWPAIQDLLGNTLRSVNNQTHPAFKCFVVCHERPDRIDLPGSVQILEAPFDAPSVDPASAQGKKAMFEMRSDKGRKLLFGLGVARMHPGSYVMFLDADDLVSNRLAEWTATNQGQNGWYFDKGFRWNRQTPNWIFARSHFYKECGSSYIIRSDLTPFPDALDLTKDFTDYYIRRYVTHAYVRGNMETLGLPLEPLPFAGAIYTFNEHNFFASHGRKSESRLRNLARLLLKGRPVSGKLRAEYCIPDAHAA